MSIPLTFDWLTVAWLKVRLHLWWKSACAAPLRLPLLLLFGLFTGCVPITRFEEAQSAAQVETEGRRRSEQRVAALEAENAEIRAQIQAQRSTLDERDRALSQAELDGSVQGKQRQDAEGMVEQLRGELARVSGHLQAYNDDKRKLETLLQGEAARTDELARLARDAALAFSQPVNTGEYALDAEGDRVVLKVPRDQLLADDGSPKPEAAAVLKLVLRIAKLHPKSKLGVEDGAHRGDAVAVSKLVAALEAQGMAAERLQPLPGPEPAPAQGQPGPDVDVSFAFSVP